MDDLRFKPERKIDNAIAARASELDQIAIGLMVRGLPSNLAERTVELIYRMGYADALMGEKMLELEE